MSFTVDRPPDEALGEGEAGGLRIFAGGGGADPIGQVGHDGRAHGFEPGRRRRSTVNDTTVAAALDRAGSATGTTSVAAAASAARSATRAPAAPARRGGGPDGQPGLGEHARHRGDQPELGGLVPQQPAERAQRLQDEVVERTAGEGHATGERSGCRRVEPELALLDAHGGGEAGVHLGQRELAQGPADPASRRPGRAPPWRATAARRRRAVRVTRLGASAGPHGGTASGRAGRRRPGPVGRADQERRGLVDRPLAGVPPVVGVRERAVVRPGRGDVRRVAGLGEGGVGVVRGHRVEAGPQRGDLVARVGPGGSARRRRGRSQ